MAFSPECAKELDIVIVLDGSNSIYPWSSIIDFLRRFIEKIEIGPKLSQVSCMNGKIIYKIIMFYWKTLIMIMLEINTCLKYMDGCSGKHQVVESNLDKWLSYIRHRKRIKKRNICRFAANSIFHIIFNDLNVFHYGIFHMVPTVTITIRWRS